MGQSTSFSAPVRSSILTGKLTIQSIEFLKCWTDEEKYQLSALKFVISEDIPSNLYYHDLKGMNNMAPLFRDESMISHCCITRDDGEVYRWYSLLWGGEIKPNDTIKYIYKNDYDSIKNPKDIKDIESTFLSKDQFTDDNNCKYIKDGILTLEVTMDEYLLTKNIHTKWGIYSLIIPSSLILSALKNAKPAPKPVIQQIVSCPLCQRNNIIKSSFKYHINNECDAI